MARECLVNAARYESEPSTHHEAWYVAVHLVAEVVEWWWGGHADVQDLSLCDLHSYRHRDLSAYAKVMRVLGLSILVLCGWL